MEHGGGWLVKLDAQKLQDLKAKTTHLGVELLDLVAQRVDGGLEALDGERLPLRCMGRGIDRVEHSRRGTGLFGLGATHPFDHAANVFDDADDLLRAVRLLAARALELAGKYAPRVELRSERGASRQDAVLTHAQSAALVLIGLDQAWGLSPDGLGAAALRLLSDSPASFLVLHAEPAEPAQRAQPA